MAKKSPRILQGGSIKRDPGMAGFDDLWSQLDLEGQMTDSTEYTLVDTELCLLKVVNYLPYTFRGIIAETS